MTDVVLFGAGGVQVAQLPAAALRDGVQAVVWRGRVFLPAACRTSGGVPFHEVATVVDQTPFVCPGCGTERADFEGFPDAYLAACPACGSGRSPVPAGLEDAVPRTVTVSRDLLGAARGELRAATGHWAAGFNALGEQITKHDRRMADGSCATCALLELLDAALYESARAEGEVVGGGSAARG